MKLNIKQVKHLRKIGHALSPVVIVADRGLVETVVTAIDEALDIHELIKVKVRMQREQRLELFNEICEKTGAGEVQTIGMVLLIYRPTKNYIISLPGPKIKAI
jgi:RNA-binding protein